ncbi:hypothetical protein JVT61DRAFT_2542 [Boletus reticuloceps]|uniref:Uncharacterized protein n=1 Tax=Boletus reticuloceps TaxID=495285 RepID=A0A8I3A9A1_9AGAM|nr:hypothetical protein JVT61DRAFT_2542 [Boletus reticuloceps]
MSFNITPAMYEEANLNALYALAKKRITSTRFFQLLTVDNEEEHKPWLDLSELVVTQGVEGFQQIKSTLRAHNPSANIQSRTSPSPEPIPAPPSQDEPRPLWQDPAAWRMVWDWAADLLEFEELQDRLARTFRDRFVFAEWSKTFDAIFDVSAPQSDDELLTSLTGKNNLQPRGSAAIRAVEDAMAAVGVSISTSRMYVPPSDSSNVSDRHLPGARARRPTKHHKTGPSIFLDIDASEGDEEEEEEEEDADAEAEAGHSTLLTRVQPAGRSYFSDALQHLITRYEQQPTMALGSATSSRSQHLPLFRLHETCLYKVDFPSKNIAHFCQSSFENHALRCQSLSTMPQRIYVEATSPLEIQNTCPPSHVSTIRSISRVPDEDRPLNLSLRPSFRPRSWVRVLRGLYKDNIAYLLSCEDNSCKVLIPPRCHPYDKPDGQEQQPPSASLFNEMEARNARCRVLTFDRDTGIVRCDGGEYHCGLLRRTYSMSSVETIEVPHPGHLSLLVESQIDAMLVKQSYLRFSIPFWKAGDLVRPKDGPLLEQLASTVSIDHDRGEVTLQP